MLKGRWPPGCVTAKNETGWLWNLKTENTFHPSDPVAVQGSVATRDLSKRHFKGCGANLHTIKQSILCFYLLFVCLPVWGPSGLMAANCLDGEYWDPLVKSCLHCDLGCKQRNAFKSCTTHCGEPTLLLKCVWKVCVCVLLRVYEHQIGPWTNFTELIRISPDWLLPLCVSWCFRVCKMQCAGRPLLRQAAEDLCELHCHLWTTSNRMLPALQWVLTTVALGGGLCLSVYWGTWSRQGLWHI